MALALPLLLLGAPVRAALAADASFVQAVDTALALVRQGQRGDFAAVGQAQRLVAQIVPQDQALAGDLTLRPYKLDDAATRLQALGAALRAPGPSPHPGADQLLAQQYDQSGSPSQGAQPSPVAAALDWIARQIADFIIHTPLVAFLGLALLIAALVVVGILIVRAAGSGGGGGDQEEADGGAARRRRGARAGDHFAAADRLAA
ncbi:MAG TPA: hypothetical protein VG245_11290, partial [Candidatus Dormibacteraeota bacterium]|nr:hypothetical protein [Candidatus Dormibacteraeota bacterium]